MNLRKSRKIFEKVAALGGIFRDLILIDQASFFNLTQMALFGVIGVKNYYVITKKYDKIVNFGAKNIFF